MSALTNWQAYLSQNPDLGAAGIDTEAEAQQHWNQFGQNEGRFQVAQPAAAAPGGITVGGQNYTAQQVKDFYASGGNDNQFAQQAGLVDPEARRIAILQARGIAGPGTMAGDAGLQNYFSQYKQFNPNGAYINDYSGWLNDLKSNPHVYDSMRSGTYTGTPFASQDWGPGGIYGPGSGHDFSFEQGRNGAGAHGTGDGWNPWTGAAGETGGVQSSQPMYVNSNGALLYKGNNTSTAPTQGQAGWVQPPQGPLSMTANPATTAAGTGSGQVQPGQIAGTAQGPAQPGFSWGAQPAQQFNTPMLDALYATQQQRMTSKAPTFNFQSKPGDPPAGALTQAIAG